MQRARHHDERTAYERRRPAPAPGRSLAMAAVPLVVLAALSEPLLTVLALEAVLLLAAWRRV